MRQKWGFALVVMSFQFFRLQMRLYRKRSRFNASLCKWASKLNIYLAIEPRCEDPGGVQTAVHSAATSHTEMLLGLLTISNFSNHMFLVNLFFLCLIYCCIMKILLSKWVHSWFIEANCFHSLISSKHNRTLVPLSLWTQTVTRYYCTQSVHRTQFHRRPP